MNTGVDITTPEVKELKKLPKKRIRIAVWVNEEGEWCAKGHSQAMGQGELSDDEKKQQALVESGVLFSGVLTKMAANHIVMVEVEVPIPNSPEATGGVSVVYQPKIVSFGLGEQDLSQETAELGSQVDLDAGKG